MKNELQNSHNQLDHPTRISNIQDSVAVAFERLNTNPRNVEGMVNDISTEFKGIETSKIQKAIRNGSLGLYGKTYGEANTQEICIWIRKYLAEGGNVVAPKMNT